MNTKQLSQGLGWFSIGLGLAELISPRRVAKTIGLSNHQHVLRTMGAREIASGLGILSGRRPGAWLWSRVAGDALDLGLLSSALRSHRNDRRRVIGAMAAVAGVAALDLLATVGQSKEDTANLRERDGVGRLPGEPSEAATSVRKAITINRPQEEVYAFWRNFENLPRFMNHLQSVTVREDGVSHWVAKGPAGTEVSWDAEIVEERVNELIVWRSLPGSTVRNVGAVTFEPATGNRGTVVRVDLKYDPPGGKLGSSVAKLFGEAPEKQIPMDLFRVKNLLETGEISRTEGQPAGRSSSTSARFDDFLRA